MCKLVFLYTTARQVVLMSVSCISNIHTLLLLSGKKSFMTTTEYSTAIDECKCENVKFFSAKQQFSFFFVKQQFFASLIFVLNM